MTGQRGTRGVSGDSTASRVQPVVEATGLVRVFGDFWLRAKARAVDGISFEISPHEIFGLLGPNGSGKSTTIKMILGLLRPTKGRLLVFGRDPSDVALKARIGYLPEESYMYRFLNPRETLDYYAKLFGIPRAMRRRRTDELLEMVGLEGAAHRAVGEFSKGMARRLGLAQALINDPEFLILDEPTSGLDPIGTRQVKDLLLDLGRRGKTILLSSHLLADVESVCDRMVVLYGGRIRAEGTTDELLTDSNRTTIFIPRIRSETITKIDELIAREEGVAIERVDSPRQRLEDLFMQIVEKARLEQSSTSGALHGGGTAAFLLGQGGDSEAGASEAVIAELERPADPTNAKGRASTTAPTSPTPSSDVVRELLARAAPAQPPAPTPPAPTAPSNIDSSMIDGLVGGTGPGSDETKARRP
ncbi:MAG: ABC transporter ATP-binding protein [Phycisphaerales bacterium]|nr:ABC transporter ATP-binding protein [Phycisphaerales bacterium]